MGEFLVRPESPSASSIRSVLGPTTEEKSRETGAFILPVMTIFPSGPCALEPLIKGRPRKVSLRWPVSLAERPCWEPPLILLQNNRPIPTAIFNFCYQFFVPARGVHRAKVRLRNHSHIPIDGFGKLVSYRATSSNCSGTTALTLAHPCFPKKMQLAQLTRPNCRW
jgi:hypothetical protein